MRKTPSKRPRNTLVIRMTVYRAYGKKVYHTNSDCSRLKDCQPQEWAESEAQEWGFSQCEYCKGNKTHGGREDTLGTRSLSDSVCTKCGAEIGSGYLCDECDTVGGWPEE